MKKVTKRLRLGYSTTVSVLFFVLNRINVKKLVVKELNKAFFIPISMPTYCPHDACSPCTCPTKVTKCLKCG